MEERTILERTEERKLERRNSGEEERREKMNLS